MTDIKFRLRTCDRFLKRIKSQPQFRQTYIIFKAIRDDLAKQQKKSTKIAAQG